MKTKKSLQDIVAITFRGLTIISKFVLSIIIIKILSIEKFGEFSLIQTTILIASFAVGFDFYAYGLREMLKKDLPERLPNLINQLLFYIAFYALLFPPLLLVFKSGLISSEYIFIFYALLVSEHLSQEIQRILVAFSYRGFAFFMMFVRSGLWVYVLSFLLLINSNFQLSLNNLLLVWFLFSIGSLIFSVIFLMSKKYDQVTFLGALDFQYIYRGFKIGSIIILGTIAYKTIEFADRYLIDIYLGKVQVGIYAFYSGIANTITIFVHTMVVIIFVPKLIIAISRKQENEFSEHFIKFSKSLKSYLIIGVVLSIIGIYPLLLILDKSEYYDNIFTYLILVISTGLWNYFTIYHTILYVTHNDKTIAFATIIGAVANLILNIILIPMFGIMGAAVSTLISFFTLSVIKLYFVRKKQIMPT